MTTATASSTMLPRRMNALKSFSTVTAFLSCDRSRVSDKTRQPGLLGDLSLSLPSFTFPVSHHSRGGQGVVGHFGDGHGLQLGDQRTEPAVGGHQRS